jgi:hypothetical protein
MKPPRDRPKLAAELFLLPYLSYLTRLTHLAFCAVLLACCVGCGSLRPRHSVPPQLVERAQIPGFSNVRILVHPMYLTAEPVDRFLSNAVTHAAGSDRPLTLLALSGGGADGAFGAGLLRGWTEEGNRPEFDLVTGISTGALIGPYAFLGPAYDQALERSYTTISDADVFRKRGILSILRRRDALTSSEPLAKTINRQITPEMLAAIAAEHRKGRRFYVGTTHLDAECIVVWDMGAIAASGHPRARKLFCDVLLASASIPIAFPPVYLDVEAEGKKFDEMHVDGGVMTQVFGPYFLSRLMTLAGKSEGRVYLIRNAQLLPDCAEVKPSLSGIAARSVDSLIKAQGFGDLFRTYAATQAAKMDFNLAFITAVPAVPRNGQFDPDYMRALFEDARSQARAGFPWAKTPPGNVALTQ